MDISEQLLSGFIKVGDLADGPRRDAIMSIRPGNFGKPDVEFQGGGTLSLNQTNLRTLANAWGTETDDWIGKEIELYVGETVYNNQRRDSVLLRPISPAMPMSERKPPAPKPQRPLADDMSDEIPF